MKRPLLKKRLVDHLVSQSIWLALEIIHIFTISPSYALLNIKIHLALFIGMSLANDIAAYRVRTWRMSDKRRTVCKRYLRANEACIFFIILPSFFAEILAPYMLDETLHLYMQIYVGTLFFSSFVLARALYDLFKAEHDPDHEDAKEQICNHKFQ